MKIRKRGVKLKLYTTPARMYIHVFSFFGTNLRSKLTLYQFLCNFFWRVINSCNEFSYIIIVSLISVSLVFLITTESQYFDDELKKNLHPCYLILYYTILFNLYILDITSISFFFKSMFFYYMYFNMDILYTTLTRCIQSFAVF